MSEEGDSSRRSTPLIKAIKDKNLDEVKRLLDEGADPNENAVGDNGAEVNAHRFPSQNQSQFCKQSGSSHSTDFNGPLHWACRFKLIDIAKLLLDNGANVYMEGEVMELTEYRDFFSISCLRFLEWAIAHSSSSLLPGNCNAFD